MNQLPSLDFVAKLVDVVPKNFALSGGNAHSFTDLLRSFICLRRDIPITRAVHKAKIRPFYLNEKYVHPRAPSKYGKIDKPIGYWKFLKDDVFVRLIGKNLTKE